MHRPQRQSFLRPLSVTELSIPTAATTRNKPSQSPSPTMTTSRCVTPMSFDTNNDSIYSYSDDDDDDDSVPQYLNPHTTNNNNDDEESVPHMMSSPYDDNDEDEESLVSYEPSQWYPSPTNEDNGSHSTSSISSPYDNWSDSLLSHDSQSHHHTVKSFGSSHSGGDSSWEDRIVSHYHTKHHSMISPSPHTTNQHLTPSPHANKQSHHSRKPSSLSSFSLHKKHSNTKQPLSSHDAKHHSRKPSSLSSFHEKQSNRKQPSPSPHDKNQHSRKPSSSSLLFPQKHQYREQSLSNDTNQQSRKHDTKHYSRKSSLSLFSRKSSSPVFNQQHRPPMASSYPTTTTTERKMIHRRSVSLTLPPPLTSCSKKTPRKTIRSQSPQWNLHTLKEDHTKKSSLKSSSTTSIKHVRSVSFPDQQQVQQQQQQVQQCDDPALFSLIASPGRCSSSTQHRICISPDVDPQLTRCYSYERPTYKSRNSTKRSNASRKSRRSRSRNSKRHYRHSSRNTSSKNNCESVVQHMMNHACSEEDTTSVVVPNSKSTKSAMVESKNFGNALFETYANKKLMTMESIVEEQKKIPLFRKAHDGTCTIQ